MEQQNYYDYQRTADRKYVELCDEVDFWKSECERLKNRYDELSKEFNSHLDRNIESSKQTIGLIFKAMLNSEQREDGILIKQIPHDKNNITNK